MEDWGTLRKVGDKFSDSEYILKVKLTGFAERLSMRYERGRYQARFQDFGSLSSYGKVVLLFAELRKVMRMRSLASIGSFQFEMTLISKSGGSGSRFNGASTLYSASPTDRGYKTSPE